MTADDLQENRRVCKFPCTSRGEGPAPGRQPRGGRDKRRAGAPFTARTRRRKPAAGPRCAAAGGAPAGRPARAMPGRPAAAPRLLHIFSKTQQPRLFPAPPPAGSCVGQGQAAGRCPVYSPYKAQEAGRRPPLLRSGGRPCGAPCPGVARAAGGRRAPRPHTPQGEKPYPLAPSSSGCSCSPRRAASSVAPVSESSAQRLVGFFRGSSCPKGTK